MRKNKQQLPSIFDDFFGKEAMNNYYKTACKNNNPSYNINEDKDNYFIDLIVPGMDKKDFKIEVKENFLVISSKVEEKVEKNNEFYSYSEYRKGSFEKRFELPDHIIHEEIKATYKAGILKLTLPKNNAKLEKKVQYIDVM